VNAAAYQSSQTGKALPTSAAAAPAPSEVCPLCGASLGPEQDWCLRCGAAARTRLAASPRWRAPVIALAVVAALALGVLAASLVKLAGDSGTSVRTVTRTIAAPATAPAGPAAGAAAGGAAATPGAAQPGATAPTQPGASAPAGTGARAPAASGGATTPAR
jgi:hypothetical protein